MEQIAQYLALGWVGSLLGILGIVLSVWFYIKSVRKAKPIAAFESIQLVGTASSALSESVTVLYQGRPVPRVAKTTAWFWNSGNQTLDRSSITSVDPIRLEIDSAAEFLSVSVSQMTREVTQFRAEISSTQRNLLLLHFDFLDPLDGAVIECLHTSNEISPEIKGVIKGIPEGVLKRDIATYTNSPERKKRNKRRQVILGTGATILGIGICIYAFFVPETLIVDPPSHLRRQYTFFMAGAVYVVLGAIILYAFRSPFPKSLRNLNKHT